MAFERVGIFTRSDVRNRGIKGLLDLPNIGEKTVSTILSRIEQQYGEHIE